MVGILLDFKYSESLWCKSIYKSLTERLRYSRVPFCEISNTVDTSLESIFIIASDREWTLSAVSQLNQSGIKPILICNQSEMLSGCMYSCVCSDINASMKNLLDTLKAENKSRVAIYGINTDSISDISRVDSLMCWRDQSFSSMQIFNNSGSLKNCFEDFYKHIDSFDAVICTNDFAAVYLVRSLNEIAPEKLRDLKVVSCAYAKISDYYRDNILSLNMNFSQYGEAAVYIYNAIKKNKYLSEITAKVSWYFDTPEPEALPPTLNLELNLSQDKFYSDPQLNEMLIVDKILGTADETEMGIIKNLLLDKTTEEIAESCFLSVSGVKYRIKKLIEFSNAQSKAQAVSLLKKYISNVLQ